MIVSRIPELVAEKVGGKDKINLSELQREVGLDYRTVSAWMKNTVTRIDFPTMSSWCKYLGCQPGDLFTYVPDAKQS